MSDIAAVSSECFVLHLLSVKAIHWNPLDPGFDFFCGVYESLPGA